MSGLDAATRARALLDAPIDGCQCGEMGCSSLVVEVSREVLWTLVAEVERMRALTTVDDAMVERAARAMVAHSGLHHPCEAGERCCDECGEAFGWPGISQAEEDLRYANHRARAALEAALGVES